MLTNNTVIALFVTCVHSAQCTVHSAQCTVRSAHQTTQPTISKFIFWRGCHDFTMSTSTRCSCVGGVQNYICYSFITFRYLDKVANVSAANVKGILWDLCGSCDLCQNMCAAVIYCSVNIVTFKFYYRLNLVTSLSRPRFSLVCHASIVNKDVCRTGTWVRHDMCETS